MEGTRLVVAIGPFDLSSPADTWPLVDGEAALARDGVQLCPFAFDRPPTPDAAIVLWWSPEYRAVIGIESHPASIVAIVGDWHIVPFEHLSLAARLSWAHVVCADARGIARLQALGVPATQTLWWRQFSFDPCLHYAGADERRDLDVVFMGRSDGGGPRDALLARLHVWAEQELGRRQRVHLQITPFPRGEEAVMYRRAHLVFNFAQRSELNMRAYEAAACGALSMLQMDNADGWQARAPLLYWQDSLLEAQLEAWLAPEAAAARTELQRRQALWVAQETPARHLVWLVRQLRQKFGL